MNIKNYTQNSYDGLKDLRNKTFKINKLEKSLIPNIKQKINILFKVPESYLQLPHETNFNFIIGKDFKDPRFNSDNKLIPYSVVRNYSKRDIRKLTMQKSQHIKSNNTSTSSLSMKSKSTKIKLSPSSHNENNRNEKEDKKIKFSNISDINQNEVFDIFNESKKRILKNKTDIFDNSMLNDIPKIMHQYINEPLSHQEKALKNNEKYKHLLNDIENNISKSMNNKKKTNKKFIFSKSSVNNIFNKSNLMRYSGTEYRMKIEKINLTEKRKRANLILDNHIQNWEMSLRRPKNFKGERRAYLNVRTDQNPYWIVLKEKNPLEDEKIISSNIKNYYRNYYNSNYLQKTKKALNSTSEDNISNGFTNLEIKGKKLIDLEEKLAKKMKGNIKIINVKYDRESLKDITFKRNYSINKYSFSQN